MRTLLVVAYVLMAAACGTVQHSVRIEDTEAFQSEKKVFVNEVRNNTGETFDIDVEQLLRDAMVKALSAKNLVGKPGDNDILAMNVNIIEYRKGDAFKRWLWPGWGSTVLVIEAALIDEEGNVDATAQASRSVDVGGGYTIGAWQTIFDSVAADLVSDLKATVSDGQAE